jgi:hypothetical protein
MSGNGQHPSSRIDMHSTTSDGCTPIGPQSGAQQSGRKEAARLQTIQELVQSGGYHIPPMLVAERILERAATEGHDRED